MHGMKNVKRPFVCFKINRAWTKKEASNLIIKDIKREQKTRVFATK